MSQLISTSELIKKYQLDTKKSLGQNFILDKNFTDKIAKSAGDLSNFEVLEIGPGPGGLTRSILDAGVKKLIVIEKDQRCILALKELQEFYGTRLEIIEGDALEIDETKIFAGNSQFKIIANLPYNIGTVLIFKWLKILPKIASMNLMLQKEVVQRICAKIGDKNYGRLAVMLNLLCDTKMLFEVNKMVFSPPPKVTSAIVQIIPNSEKIEKYFDQNNLKKFEKIVQQAFNQRRKMLKSSLKGAFVNQDLAEVFTKCDIDGTKRPEELAIEEFWKMVQFKN
jgi:16S rRNA (adenine1518-N6/adenine1519-N6)-dimethyltransferase